MKNILYFRHSINNTITNKIKDKPILNFFIKENYILLQKLYIDIKNKNLFMIRKARFCSKENTFNLNEKLINNEEREFPIKELNIQNLKKVDAEIDDIKQNKESILNNHFYLI